MGAFLMVKEGCAHFNNESALEVFRTMGLREPRYFLVGGWNIWSYNKIRSDEDHYVQQNGALLVCAGTPIYRTSKDFSQSIELIFHDLQAGEFDYRNIRGSYALLYSKDNSIPQLYTDQAGIWNIYFDEQNEVLSTSFLSLVFGSKKKVTLNRMAATEIITSGRLIGPDTLFNGLSRLEISLANNIGEIVLVKDDSLMTSPGTQKGSFTDSVNEQVDALNNYFNDIKNFGDHYGVDSGLTAGHDSRMMLIQIRKYFKNFQIHSFWRKKKDLELTVAEKVAEKANVPLRVIEGKHHMDKTPQQLEETLKKSLFFYDGHIRMHCFLMEDYHTIEHRTAILGDKKLGINGIGGEQYRNEWHMELPWWSLNYFSKHTLAYQLSGKCFRDKQFEARYFTYLQKKLLAKLGLKAGTTWLSRKDVQKYYNEIYVASLMGVRTNAENALGHFITPFIDRQLTRTAYRSLPHHGISFEFQQAMIRKMDAELASVQSGYGYSFADGEPVKKKIKYLLKEFTPTWLYERKIEKKMQQKGNNDFKHLVEKYPVFRESVQLLHKFRMPLDEQILTSRPDIMPVYLSLAYFLYYLSQNDRLEISAS